MTKFGMSLAVLAIFNHLSDGYMEVPYGSGGTTKPPFQHRFAYQKPNVFHTTTFDDVWHGGVFYGPHRCEDICASARFNAMTPECAPFWPPCQLCTARCYTRINQDERDHCFDECSLGACRPYRECVDYYCSLDCNVPPVGGSGGGCVGGNCGAGTMAGTAQFVGQGATSQMAQGATSQMAQGGMAQQTYGQTNQFAGYSGPAGNNAYSGLAQGFGSAAASYGVNGQQYYTQGSMMGQGSVGQGAVGQNMMGQGMMAGQGFTGQGIGQAYGQGGVPFGGSSGLSTGTGSTYGSTSAAYAGTPVAATSEVGTSVAGAPAPDSTASQGNTLAATAPGAQPSGSLTEATTAPVLPPEGQDGANA